MDFDENEFDYGGDEIKMPKESPLQKILANRKLLFLIIAIILAIIVIIALIIAGVILIAVLVGGDDDGKDWKYGVMVDLGSSGSRIHVFQWSDSDPVQPAPHNGGFFSLLFSQEYWYKEQKPGVSSYASNPKGAGASLEPLLNFAVEKLNSVDANITDTPIFLYATAGLRLLPKSQSDAILASIRNEIKTQYQFLFIDQWCDVITGTSEASFDWLSIQQIIFIESFYDSSFSFFQFPESSSSSTFGVIDLGGGSVEISFFPSSAAIGDSANEEEFALLEFNDEEYSVYGHSYLGFGHNSARSALQSLLISAQSPSGTIKTITDPCAVEGSSRKATINGTEYTFVGSGNVEECVAANQQLLDKSIPCNYSSCAFLGVYQPDVVGSNFVGLDDLATVSSFFGIPENPKLSQLLEKTSAYCLKPWSQILLEYPQVPAYELERNCFEGIYIYELLTYGFGFAPSSQQILLAESLYGIELSWALGAMTHEVTENNF